MAFDFENPASDANKAESLKGFIVEARTRLAAAQRQVEASNEPGAGSSVGASEKAVNIARERHEENVRTIQAEIAGYETQLAELTSQEVGQ